MEVNNSRKYLLAIKRNNNDYLPLEWNLIKIYNNENLNTLKGIDEFTSKINPAILIAECLNSRIVDQEEKFRNFEIIYYEKGKYRELKEGPIFEDKNYYFDENYFIEKLKKYIKDKEFRNSLINKLEETSETIKAYKIILKNIERYLESDNATIAALSQYQKLSYEEIRNLKYLVFEKFGPIVDKKETNKKILNKDN